MKRTVLLVKALLMGLRVNICGLDYCLDDHHKLCAVGQNVDTGEEVLLVVNFGLFDLADYVMLSKRMTDNEAIVIGMNVALNEDKEAARLLGGAETDQYISKRLHDDGGTLDG